MDLTTVNEDANFIIELKVNDKWEALTQEYSFSAAINVMRNACVLTNIDSRVMSKRTGKLMAEVRRD